MFLAPCLFSKVVFTVELATEENIFLSLDSYHCVHLGGKLVSLWGKLVSLRGKLVSLGGKLVSLGGKWVSLGLDDED